VDPVGFDQQGRWVTTHEEWSLTGILPNATLRLAHDRVAAIRDACGPDMDIIVELHSFTDANTSIQLGRVLEDLGCYYFEEPTAPLNPRLFSEIAREVKIPIAAGERIYTRWGFRPFLEDRSLHIIQPDLGTCGGIGEGKKICDMARVYDVGVQVHVCGSPVATAVALQLEAAIPNFVIHEQHANALRPENITTCEHDYQPRDGRFSVPDLPGIGQELSKDALEHAEIVSIS
jgi:L-alanine-DL-glutamate epimerase-like enolase superfamily enzyme